MSETAWSSWLNEVMPDLPGAPPQGLVTNAIRNAAIEFCERTKVYRLKLDPVAVDADVPDYPLEPPARTKVVEVIRAWYDGKEIYPRSEAELNALYTDWPTITGTPLHFTQVDPETLLLVPMPEAALQEALVTFVALKPSRAATGIFTEIYEKYLEEIAWGAKQRLFAMQRKPWSDTTLAAHAAERFQVGIGRGKRDADRAHVRTRKRVASHFF